MIHSWIIIDIAIINIAFEWLLSPSLMSPLNDAIALYLVYTVVIYFHASNRYLAKISLGRESSTSELMISCSVKKVAVFKQDGLKHITGTQQAVSLKQTQ